MAVAWMIRPNGGAYYWQQADVVYWGTGLNVDSPVPEYEKVLEGLSPLPLNENQVLSLEDPNILEFTTLKKSLPTADGDSDADLFVDTDWYDKEDGSRVFSTAWTLTPTKKEDLTNLQFEWAYGPMDKDFT